MTTSKSMVIQNARKKEKGRNGNVNLMMLMRMGYMLHSYGSVKKLGCWVWSERGVKGWVGRLMKSLKALLCSSIRGNGARECISACYLFIY